MRYGIYGGSFDPVHYGHLLLAESGLCGAKLDRVIFVPTGVPPHKQHQKHLPGEIRAEMLESAIAGIEEFLVSRFEIERDPPSYTVETLRHFRSKLLDAELFLLVGADMYYDLPNWYCASEILQLAVPVGVHRPGYPPPHVEVLSGVTSSERLRIFRDYIVEMPLVDFSATKIRQNCSSGKSIRFQTPHVVENFIHSRHLYEEP
ncbi:MAG: nicotinate-nucleotide adenylyltransferase [Planctomycetaceae bacterium]|jgi:nicotinate-nucleotide adenylyltransferase|nr:nicotinate-nucleotide adenylyltransferase [Planctomycetaceae bacterium]